MDGVLGLAGGALPVVVWIEGDLGDGAPVSAEPVEVGALVLLALALDELGLGVLGCRLGEAPERNAPLELSQVPAGQVARQVGGREGEAAVARLHAGRVSLRKTLAFEDHGPMHPLRRSLWMLAAR